MRTSLPLFQVLRNKNELGGVRHDLALYLLWNYARASM